jgi:sulfur carrier protein
VNVTRVVGEETVSVAADATSADLCRPVDHSSHEVTVPVDGTPVPGDTTVETERVKLLWPVKGG